jgi:signal recognition particle subunit SRP72
MMVFCPETGLQKLQAENYEPEEMDTELQPISVMRAYVLQLLGETEEAMSRYNTILKSEHGDDAAIATAANNMVSLRVGEEKVFESLKRIARATKVSEDILSPRLRKALRYNQALLAFHGKQNQRCQTICKDFISRDPTDEFPHLVLAALYFREKQFAKSEAELANVSTDFGVLVKASLLIQSNKVKQAIEALESLQKIRFEPAVVSVVVNLYDKVGDVSSAVKFFDSAIAHQQKVTKDTKKASLLRMRSASFKFRKGLFQECVKEFETLVAEDEKSGDIPLDVISSMVVAAARVGSNVAAKYADQLPPLVGMGNVNVAELEAQITTPLDLIKKREKSKEDQESKEGDQGKVKKPKKKNRKKRLPKNFDPANPGPLPDPERWLPRWQRSSKKKYAKKNKEAMMFRGPQGSSETQITPEHSRRSSGAAPIAVSSPTATSPVAGAPKPAVKRGNQKKKGKR